MPQKSSYPVQLRQTCEGKEDTKTHQNQEVEMSKKRVTVKAMMTVVSATPVKAGKTYPLSVLDHAMGAHDLRMVFYYNNKLDKELLKDSLTEVLSFYLPVTGRLRRRVEEDGNWEVKCTDAGVRLLEAKVDATLDEWLRSADASEELDLTHWVEMPEDPYIWSPFYVQMNEFEGGGIAIGLSCTHMHADPICATLLVKAWSDMHRHASIAYPPFFHPPGLRGRTTPNTNTQSATYYAAKSTAKSPPHSQMSTATFRFSDSAVKKCLSEVQDRCPDATPFDALAALFWSRTVAAKAAATVNTSCTLSICIEFRKRLHAPLPHGFYGNALHFSSVSSEMDPSEMGFFGHLADIIHRHMSSALVEEEYWSAIEWLESHKDSKGKLPPPFRMYGPELTCSNLENVLAYTAAFEKDVKPVHVGYHIGNVDGEGLILVLPSPEEGLARTVSVTLPVEQLDKVLNDCAILHLEPMLLFSGK